MIYDHAIEIVLTVLAYTLGWWQRNRNSKRRWRLIHETAEAELASPAGTNDPIAAMAKAVISVNRPRIISETQKLKTQPEPTTLTAVIQHGGVTVKRDQRGNITIHARGDGVSECQQADVPDLRRCLDELEVTAQREVIPGPVVPP